MPRKKRKTRRKTRRKIKKKNKLTRDEWFYFRNNMI